MGPIWCPPGADRTQVACLLYAVVIAFKSLFLGCLNSCLVMGGMNCWRQEAKLANVRKALRANNYPEWALDIPPAPSVKKNLQRENHNTTRHKQQPMQGIPYLAERLEKLDTIYTVHGEPMCHLPTKTLRSKLVHPERPPPSPMEHKRGTTYQITCNDDQDHTHIG